MTGTANGGPGTGPARATRALPLLAALGLLPGGWACGGDGPAGPGERGVPTEVAVVAGDGVAAPAGTVVPEGPTVAVRNGAGEPVSGVEVDFEVVRGGGRVDPSTATTDGSGRAGTIWVLGVEPGSDQALKASIGGGLSTRIEATAAAPAAGEIHQGREGYTAWLVGDLPLILSAPHGGDLRPAEIPNRGYGVTVKDLRTLELALAIQEAVEARTGGRPHLVYTRLHRTKLDANRKIEEAAQGQPAAERAWHEYHAYLEAAGAQAERGFGAGLVLDVHGHGHDIPRIELGYLLDDDELALSDATLGSGGYAGSTSIRDLVDRSPATFPELLRGSSSLGGLLNARGVSVVPGPATPHPGDAPYFSGGYITRRHGSAEGGAVSAIQLEHHWPGLRDTEPAREAYASKLTEALAEYFSTHFGRELGPEPTSAPAPFTSLLSRNRAPGPPRGTAASGGSPSPSAPPRR